MTLLKLAIFDESKTIQQVVLTSELEKDKWLTANPDITDNYVIFLDSEEKPSIGWFWDEEKNTWIPPKPYSNWILDSSNVWIPPKPKPSTEPEGDWFWHQEENNWVDIVHVPEQN